jgi:hypothetical protein
MYQLSSKITIYNKEQGDTYNLDFAESVEISTSWDMLFSKANLTLPKKIYVNKNGTPFRISWADMNIANLDILNSGLTQNPTGKILSEGDIVKIELGYDGDLNTVFEGFILKIEEEVPIKLTCVDAMYILDGITITEDDDKLTLDKLIKIIQGAYNGSKLHAKYEKGRGAQLYKRLEFVATDKQDLPGFSVGSKTIAEIFSKLKKEFKIDTFIQNGTVFCGTPYPTIAARDTSLKKSLSSFFSIPEKKRFGFQYNVIEDKLISSSAKTTNLEILVTGVGSEGGSFKDVNQSSAAEGSAGEAGSPSIDTPKIPIVENTIKKASGLKGERENKKIKIVTYTKDEATLKAIAKRELDKVRYDGYNGYFLTFGKPFIQQGDTVEMQDFNLPARSGKFKVKRVDYSFGAGGFRQKIELHMRVV